MSTSPFFFFENLKFDAAALLAFADTIPANEWTNPQSLKQATETGSFNTSADTSFNTDVQWWIASSKISDFSKCAEVNRIADYFTINGNPLFRGMAFKKTKKHFVQPFCPLMQNKEMDKRNGIVRTYDIIVPLKGGFNESPIESKDTTTNTLYTLQYTGQAYMVPTNPEWHYRWEETVEDYRYTFHLRGAMPTTYEMVKDIYNA